MTVKKILSHLKLLLLYIVTGIVCGGIGTLFSKSISFVTTIRHNTPWTLYLLPVAGIVSVALYQLLKVTDMGTNHVIRSTRDTNDISPKLLPAVFSASVLSHLFGASVGREGAALQLGGSTAVYVSRLLKLDRSIEKTLIYCGMAGVFASVFGTPLAAAFFALEVVFVGHLYYRALFPVCITSFVSYYTAMLLGARAERFAIVSVPSFSFDTVWKTVLISFLAAGVSILFCLSLKYTERLFEHLFRNAYLRIALGGIVVVLLTVAVGNYDYNGAGTDVIERIFHNGEFSHIAFLLKLLFTAIAVGSGFKGGEIVPTLFIGATFGALMGTLFGLPVAFAAALCMIVLFCGVTNCPLASIFLAAELFSGKGIGYMAIAVVVCYCASGKISLYSAQQVDGLKKWF